MTRLVAGAGAVVLAFAACGSDAGGTGRSRLHVFAAASLTEVFRRIDDSPIYQFAGSDELALQIGEGAPADVFAAAGPRYPVDLHGDGIVERPVTFATNELVMIVPKANPAGIGSVEDLKTAGIRLVIGAEGVPVGDYARIALGDLDEPEVFERVVSEEQDVKGIVGKVLLGEADAGIVYATDVQPVIGEVSTIELPQSLQPAVKYMVAVVSETDERAEAESFVEALLSEKGQRELRAAGFGAP